MSLNESPDEKAIRLKQAVLKLFETPEYKEVFEEAYFTKEASRLALAIVDDEMQDDVEQRTLNEKIRSIGHLHIFLNTLIQFGTRAEVFLKQSVASEAQKDIVEEYDEITGAIINDGSEV